MAVTAGTLLPVDFTPPGQPTPNENGHDSHNDAFHLLTSDNNAILPNTSTSPPTIVQVRRGGSRGGNSGGNQGNNNGNNNGTERTPNNNSPKPDDNQQNRNNQQRGNKNELELNSEQGQQQGQQGQQEQSDSKGFPLRWDNPFNLLHQMVDLFTNDKHSERPAYGMNVDFRKLLGRKRR